MFRTASALAAKGADEVDVRLSAYQLTLRGLRLPVVAHLIFNAITAAGLLLLGHPFMAAWLFIGASGFDAAQQLLLSRWYAASLSAQPDEASGIRKLGALCVVRVAAYTGPTFVMACGGHHAEFAVWGIQLTALLTVALGAGALSRAVFWGLTTPLIAQAAILSALLFTPPQLIAVLLGLLVLTVLLVAVSERTVVAMTAWHEAFLSNLAVVDELAAARDQALSERIAAEAAREAAREANSAKSNFLATMSHEIRTPMNGVLGMAQLIKRDEKDPVQAERLQVLVDSGEYLLAILNDILDVSKIDAGKLDIATSPEAVRPFLRRLTTFWSARAEERGVALDLHVGDEVPETVLVDGLRLRQVMFNLVGNALKFTEAGSVRILAEAAQWDHDSVLLHLSVQDTGPGIAGEHLPQLFDRFSQGDDSEARRYGGTGLGLAIVKQLVELMDGRVWIESELGVGSTFHVEIPLLLAQDQEDTELLDDNAPQPIALDPLVVLAVDDNSVNLLVLDQLLGSLGQTVVKAASGAAALEAMAEQQFDLVLADIQMPGMTGVELLAKMRATPGPNQSVPVIALTADVTSGGRQRYLELGFTEHSSKPIQLQDLLGAMVRAMSAVSNASERAA